MMSGPEDENVRRYLLGEMPDRERTDFEDRCFADDNFYQTVLAAEDDLIDAYVRDELAAHAKLRFEARYLASPRLSSRIDFARGLHQRRAGRDRASFSIWARWRPVRAVWFAAAAALVVMAAVSWWFGRRNASMPSAPSIAQQQRHSQRTEEPQIRGNAVATYVAFVLAAGAERGTGTQPRLVIPPTAQEVRLEVKLEATGFRKYDAELRTVEGKQIWRLSGVAEQTGTLNLDVPANLLQTADYVLTVSGTERDGTREIAGEYPLSVRKL
jgi:hypothetical protein